MSPSALLSPKCQEIHLRLSILSEVSFSLPLCEPQQKLKIEVFTLTTTGVGNTTGPGFRIHGFRYSSIISFLFFFGAIVSKSCTMSGSHFSHLLKA